jgi:hypothetical protein
MMTRLSKPRSAHRRRGFLTPAIMVALFVAMIGVAVALDQLWLENAEVELNTAVEASALAAARQLATDDLLRSNSRSNQRIKRARQQAIQVASRNHVAGTDVEIDGKGRGSIQFGRRIFDPQTNRSQFVESKSNPTSVIVTAERSRRQGNPIALWFRQLTHQPAGDVASRAQATLDNRIIGFRPLEEVPVPALPFAILEDDPKGKRTDTWNAMIEQRQGEDNYSYNAKTGRVKNGPDGIPEIVLRTLPLNGTDEESNLQLIDIQTDFQPKKLRRQIKRGWTRNDLKNSQDEIQLSRNGTQFTSLAYLTDGHPRVLRGLIGQCRICMLYRNHAINDAGFGTVDCRRFVAGRIMSVRRLPDDACEIVFQPGVMTTPTALLISNQAPTEQQELAINRYIYKLQITH